MSFHYKSWMKACISSQTQQRGSASSAYKNLERWMVLLVRFWKTHRISMGKGWRKSSRTRREMKEWHRGQYERVNTVAHSFFSACSVLKKLTCQFLKWEFVYKPLFLIYSQTQRFSNTGPSFSWSRVILPPWVKDLGPQSPKYTSPKNKNFLLLIYHHIHYHI